MWHMVRVTEYRGWQGTDGEGRMMVPADSHNRGRISESVAWGCAAASCVALAALGFVSLA